jgi:hypothetical protein
MSLIDREKLLDQVRCMHKVTLDGVEILIEQAPAVEPEPGEWKKALETVRRRCQWVKDGIVEVPGGVEQLAEWVLGDLAQAQERKAK